jgi:hypothetical protein
MLGSQKCKIAEPLVPGPHPFEQKNCYCKVETYKSLAIDQIPAELFLGGGGTLSCEIHNLISYIWNKRELLEQ